MMTKNSVDPGSKARIRKEREKAAQRFAAKAIVTAQGKKDPVQKIDESVKNTTENDAM